MTDEHLRHLTTYHVAAEGHPPSNVGWFHPNGAEKQAREVANHTGRPVDVIERTGGGAEAVESVLDTIQPGEAA